MISQLEQFPQSVRNILQSHLRNIKNETQNKKILDEAQQEIEKLNACLTKINRGGNNPMVERRKVCNLKSIKNKLTYLSRIANPFGSNNKKRTEPIKKSTKLLK